MQNKVLIVGASGLVRYCGSDQLCEGWLARGLPHLGVAQNF